MSEERVPVLQFRPVTPDRLGDLARFSEKNGKFCYCSCMRWRLYTYMGSPETFRKAGFRDVTPASQARRVMRCEFNVDQIPPK